MVAEVIADAKSSGQERASRTQENERKYGENRVCKKHCHSEDSPVILFFFFSIYLEERQRRMPRQEHRVAGYFIANETILVCGVMRGGVCEWLGADNNGHRTDF